MIKNKTKNKKDKLFNPNFMWFWQGQIVSSIGSQIYYMAMIIWITEVTDSASLLGLMGMIAGIPTILFSVIGGTVADRYSRKKILLFCDVFNAILLFVLSYIFYSYDETTSVLVSSVMAVAFLSGIIASFFIPAGSAAIPDLVPHDKLTGANSFRQSANQIATILGWTVSSFLYVYLGIIILSLFNAVTFVYGAFTKYLVHIPTTKRKKSDSKGIQIFKNDLKEGLIFVWNNKGLRKIVFASVLINFFAIPVLILMPFYVKDQLLISNHWLPILLSIDVGGTMLGVILAGAVKLKSNQKVIAIYLAMLINAVFVFILGINSTLIGAIVSIIFIGVGAGFIQVHIQTLMQITTNQQIRGRVFGLISTVTGALTPIGMGLFGYLGDLTDKNFFVIYGVSGIILAIVSVFAILSRDIKEFLSFEESKENKADKTEDFKNNKDTRAVLNLEQMKQIKEKINFNSK